MGKFKSEGDAPEQVMKSSSAEDKKPEPPAKQDGPIHIGRDEDSAMVSPAQLQDQGSTIRRAQLARSMQQTMGNAQVNRELSRIAASHTDKATPAVGPDTRAALNKNLSGQNMPDETRTKMEKSFGSDLSRVRVHTDSQADKAARELKANAFATGQDIYFKEGHYQPHTPQGQQLLAHELAHTVQQKEKPIARDASQPEKQTPVAPKTDDSQAAGVRTAGADTKVSKPGDAIERQAEVAADKVSKGMPVPAGTVSRMADTEGEPTAATSIARQSDDQVAAHGGTMIATAPATEGKGAAPAPAKSAAGTPGAPSAPGKGVSLASPTFNPTPEIAATIKPDGSTKVPVSLGKLAQGEIAVRKAGNTYETPERQAIPLSIPVLEPLRAAKIDPVLAVEIKKGAISGYLTVNTKSGPAPNPEALMGAIKSHSREFGWAGIDVTKLPDVKSSLKDGTLIFQADNFPIKLGGFVDGTANFAIHNEQVTFSGQGNIQIGGVANSTLDIKRDEKGVLAGNTELNLTLSKFTGNVKAAFVGGIMDVQGTVAYKTEKLSGEITILLVDAATANNLAKQQLPPEKIIGAAKAAQTPAPDAEGPKPGPRKLAGYGTVDFAFTDWLAGKATVIVDGKGDVTIVGKIAPPAEKELFAQKDYSKELIKLEVRAPYGIPVVGNVYLFANVSLHAEARIGPAKIYNIEIEGVYSTDPSVLQNFQMAASFNMSAYAGLKLRGEGGVGLEILAHDIKAGAGIFAIAGVKGYVDARPTIGYREKADPKAGKKGEFFIKGHMELAAQPFLGLGGDLFVEVDSPWWSPLPDKKWTWPLGQLEYPLPGEFGLGADVDYVLGSHELPEIKFSEAKFDSQKFMTDIMRENVPPKSKGEQEKPAKFQESGDTKGAAAKGAGAGGKPKAGGGMAPGKAPGGGPPKSSVQPGGKKKDKKPPTDKKEKAEGEKKKKELLKGGKKPDPEQSKSKDKKDKKDKDKDAKTKTPTPVTKSVTMMNQKHTVTAKVEGKAIQIIFASNPSKIRVALEKTIAAVKKQGASAPPGLEHQLKTLHDALKDGEGLYQEWINTPKQNVDFPTFVGNALIMIITTLSKLAKEYKLKDLSEYFENVPAKRYFPRGYKIRSLYDRMPGRKGKRDKYAAEEKEKLHDEVVKIKAAKDLAGWEQLIKVGRLPTGVKLENFEPDWIRNGKVKYEVDHKVSLAEKWRKGKDEPSDEKRWEAHNEDNLQLLTKEANQKKGSTVEGSPEEEAKFDRWVGLTFKSQYADGGQDKAKRIDKEAFRHESEDGPKLEL